jgi:galactokinase
VRGEAADVRLASTLHGASEAFAADGSGAPPPGWGRYAHAVAAELAALERPPVGLDALVSSDLPAGAGLSSSAALEVSVALALCAVAGFELDPLELALACQRAELRAVGVPCGILDQAASVLGRAGSAMLLDCGTLERRYVEVPARAAFVVVDSGVPRSLEKTAYAERRAELERALAGATDAVAVRRLRHVTTENERVRRFAEALDRDDLPAAGALLLESHASLRDDYEVSIPELDRLVERAAEAGAHGARLLGAGFGGSVLVLADADRAEAVGRAVAEASGRPAGPIVVQASGGARVGR